MQCSAVQCLGSGTLIDIPSLDLTMQEVKRWLKFLMSSDIYPLGLIVDTHRCHWAVPRRRRISTDPGEVTGCVIRLVLVVVYWTANEGYECSSFHMYTALEVGPRVCRTSTFLLPQGIFCSIQGGVHKMVATTEGLAKTQENLLATSRGLLDGKFSGVSGARRMLISNKLLVLDLRSPAPCPHWTSDIVLDISSACISILQHPRLRKRLQCQLLSCLTSLRAGSGVLTEVHGTTYNSWLCSRSCSCSRSRSLLPLVFRAQS